MKPGIKIALLVLAVAGAVCLLAPAAVNAQGQAIDGVTFGPAGTPKGGVTVTVCAQGSTVTGGVCSPAESDANCCFADSALSVRLSGTATGGTAVSDGLGNYLIWAAPGTYLVSFSGPGVVPATFTKVVSCVAGGCGSGASLTAQNTWTQQQNFTETQFKGINPWTDIRAFGGRAINPGSPPEAGLTITVTGGQAAATFSPNGGGFQNGDGLTIWGAGAACSLSTPSAPTVTPSVLSGPMNTGMVVNANAGSSSYTYRVVAVGKNGCYTAASSATTVNTANTVGTQTATISGYSKTNNINTYTTSAPHGIVVGALVMIRGTADNNNFGGACRVSAVPDNTHFSCKSPTDTRAGAPASIAAGGTATYTNANHVTWNHVTNAYFYLIYSASSLVGISKIQNEANSIIDTSWDDLGATLQGTPTFPSGMFPSSPPGSPRNDWFTTTIVSGGGTANVVLAAAPITSVAGATVKFDDAPALAAAGAFGSPYIPYAGFPNQFVFWSYTTIGSGGFGALFQQGGIIQNWTFELPANMQWFGNVHPAGYSVLAFANGGGAPILCNSAIPCMWEPNPGTQKLRGFSLTTQNNGYGLVIDLSNGGQAEDLNFSPLGGTEGVTMPVLLRNAQFEEEWHNITINASQTGSATTPVFFCNRCATLRLNTINLSGRGIFFNGTDLMVDYGRKQGGTSPMIWRAALGNSSPVGGVATVDFTADDVVMQYELDTDPTPLVAVITPATSSVVLHTLWIKHGLPLPSIDSGGTALPVISGDGYPAVQALGAVSNQTNGSGTQGIVGWYGSDAALHPTYGGLNNYGRTSQQLFAENVNITGGNGITVAFNVPIPTATPTTSGCGGVFPPAGNYYYQLVIIGNDGVASQPSWPSGVVTTNGSQCVAVSWTDVAGHQGYKVYANGALLFSGGCNSTGTLIQANNCLDTKGTQTSGSLPSLNGTGEEFCYFGIGCGGRAFIFGSQVAGTYGKNTMSGPSGGFTGQRSTTLPDGNSATTLTTSFTTTAAASDNVSLQGVTASSHCGLTATNANAATDSTGTFVSAVSANQVTVTHPANSGRTWNVFCTPN